MKWFQHDTDANQDAKLQNVLLDYGLEGYGLYWYCLELIIHKVDNDCVTFELEHDARIIARNTGSTPQKVEEMMRYFVKERLFESNGSSITCFKAAKRLTQSMTSNAQMREIIDSFKSHDGIMIESRIVMQDKIRLDNTRVEKNINTTSTSRFNEFWDLYDKKTSRAKCEPKFNKLKQADIELIFEALPKYIKSTKNKKYRKDPATWLNGKCWNDEITSAEDYQFVADEFNKAFEHCGRVPMAGMMTQSMIDNYVFLINNTNLTKEKLINYFNDAASCRVFQWARDDERYEARGIEFYLEHDSYEKIKREF